MRLIEFGARCESYKATFGAEDGSVTFGSNIPWEWGTCPRIVDVEIDAQTFLEMGSPDEIIVTVRVANTDAPAGL